MGIGTGLAFIPDWLRLGIPVDPDAPHARDLLLRELSKPPYQAAKPSWLDLAAEAVKNWIASLFTHGTGVGNVLSIVGITVLVCLIVGALIIFGLPRLNRRAPRHRSVFDGVDERSADELRRSARAAAREADWATAIAEIFRACIAGLSERTLVAFDPGTTAHAAAERSTLVFPSFGSELHDAAGLFDLVRYLGQAGSEAKYQQIRDLDDELQSARPAQVPPLSAISTERMSAQ